MGQKDCGMERQRKLQYSDFEESIKDMREYVRQLERERDDALKQVERWNEEDAVFEAKQAQKEAEEWANEAMARASEGFTPTKAQWNVIRQWEQNHEMAWHPSLDPKEMTKYNPNAPEYRYEFQYLTPLDGKCGCVTCLTCARKALRRSFGNEWLYYWLCEKYDARYKLEEM